MHASPVQLTASQTPETQHAFAVQISEEILVSNVSPHTFKRRQQPEMIYTLVIDILLYISTHYYLRYRFIEKVFASVRVRVCVSGRLCI